MTKPKATRPFPPVPPNPLFLKDEELIEGLELLEFALQSLRGDQTALLDDLDLGRSHQQLLHFIGRRPGVTMVDLLKIVPLTKQSLSRLLKELTAKGLITQTKDETDRRQRLLELTVDGRALDQRLSDGLRRRLADAYRAAGAEAVAGYHQVLEGLIDEPARRYFHRVKTNGSQRWQPS
ncbi:MAG: MarR family winged helix-turn-helix transcriptional regulator [Geminicoccaceae bacterium]